MGITTRPVLIGPFTLLQLTDFEEGLTATNFADSLVAAYGQVFEKLAELGAEKIQLDEPSLVKDLTAEEKPFSYVSTKHSWQIRKVCKFSSKPTSVMFVIFTQN